MRRIVHALAFGASLATSAAGAVTIIVDSDSETPVAGKCTLAEAVVAANTNAPAGNCVAGGAGSDTIVFDAGVGTITFTQPLLASIDALRVTEELVIDGTANGGVIIQRDAGAATAFRLIEVVNASVPILQAPALVLYGVEMRHGQTPAASGAAGSGGCLLTHGALTLQDSAFTDCHTQGTSANGGAVAQLGFGTVEILRGLFKGNTAAEGNGGGLYSESEALTLRDSTFMDNAADNGGIGGLGGNGGVGGGLAGGEAFVGRPATIEGSTFSGNRAANSGGGLWVVAPAVLRNTTISGNRSDFGSGAGLLLSGSGADPMPGRTALVTLQNATVANNRSGESSGLTGGAYAGGLYYDSNPSTGSSTTGLEINSTLFVGNTAMFNNSITHRDLGAQNSTTPIGSHNLSRAIGVGGSNYQVDMGGGDLATCDPLLGTLGDNGGPTLTHALLAGSCALDAGSNPDGLATDQRGGGFPRVTGTAADIGAYEGEGDGGATTSLAITPASLAFGNIVVGTTSASKLYTLTNTGTEPVAFTSFELDGAGFASVAAESTCGPSLASAASCVVSFHFTPTAAGPYSGDFIVTSNAPAITVTMSGSGVTDAPPRGPGDPPAPVPALGGIALGLLGASIALAGALARRRRR
jgi:hypothetical protein